MQKFTKGDLVHVAANLGSSMSHFDADIDAIVIGSYNDQFGGSDERTPSYTLFLKGRGECSWYFESQLELIEKNRADLLKQWEAEQDAEIKQASDLDWIFENGPQVAKKPHGASVQALADSKGLGSLWGSRGEGITYYIRSGQVLAVATPFLMNRDKAGWLALELR
jgi:hypothetical protein